MAAPTNGCNVKKVLANPEPSTHGPRERGASRNLLTMLGLTAFVPAALKSYCVGSSEMSLELVEADASAEMEVVREDESSGARSC